MEEAGQIPTGLLQARLEVSLEDCLARAGVLPA